MSWIDSCILQTIPNKDEDLYFNINNGATTMVEACSNPLQADVVEAVGFLSENNPPAQNAIASIRGAPEIIVQLYDDDDDTADNSMTDMYQDQDVTVEGNFPRRRRDDTAVGSCRQLRRRRIELVTTRVIAKLVTGHRDLQSGFVGAGVTSWLIALLRRPGCDVATLEATVEAIWRLADGTDDVQKQFIAGPDTPDSAATMVTVASDDADDIIAGLLDVATRSPGQLHHQRIQDRESVRKRCS